MTGDVYKVQGLHRGVRSSLWRAKERVPEEAHVEAGDCPHVDSNTLLTGDINDERHHTDSPFQHPTTTTTTLSPTADLLTRAEFLAEIY